MANLPARNLDLLFEIVPPPVTVAAQHVLDHWGLVEHLNRFVLRPGGWAVLALLANAAAKQAEARDNDAARTIARVYYGHKLRLLGCALDAPGTAWWARPHGGYTVGEAFIPTAALFIELVPTIGQLSFHVRLDAPELRRHFDGAFTPERQRAWQDRHWDGLAGKQERARELALGWLAAQP